MHISPLFIFFHFRVTLVFGVITCFGGICGVVLGSLSSQYYRRIDARADPLICAYSMIAAVPLVYFACLYASSNVGLSYVSIANIVMREINMYFCQMNSHFIFKVLFVVYPFA